MDWDCSRFEVPHRAQIAGLWRAMLIRSLAPNTEVEAQGWTDIARRCTLLNIRAYCSFCNVSAVATYALNSFSAFKDSDVLDMLDVLMCLSQGARQWSQGICQRSQGFDQLLPNWSYILIASNWIAILFSKGFIFLQLYINIWHKINLSHLKWVPYYFKNNSRS